MQYFGQKTKQPSLPPPTCQPKTGIKSALGCAPQYGQPSYPPQRRQPCPPQSYTPECIQPCPPQYQPSYVPRCPPQSCAPQSTQMYPPPPQQGYAPQRIQSYPSQRIPQASYGTSQGFQPSCVLPCKSGSVAYQKTCASSCVPQCSPKGKASYVPQCGQGYAPRQTISPCPQQGLMKGSQQWSSEPYISKGAQCASQPCATPGGPACATKSGQQSAEKYSVDTGNQVCIMKCGQQYTSQQCVTKGGPVCATKGSQQNTTQQCVSQGAPVCITKGNQSTSQQCVAKGGRKGGRKTGSCRKSNELKLSDKGQLYRSADNWFFN